MDYTMIIFGISVAVFFIALFIMLSTIFNIRERVGLMMRKIYSQKEDLNKE